MQMEEPILIRLAGESALVVGGVPERIATRVETPARVRSVRERRSLRVMDAEQIVWLLLGASSLAALIVSFLA